MNYNLHRIGGLTVASVTGMYLYQQQYTSTYQVFTSPNYPILPNLFCFGILGGFAILGSVLPDIDLPNSYIGKKVPAISRKINTRFGHRGLTHYPSTLIVISLLLLIIFQNIEMITLVRGIYFWGSVGFVGGYLSHILLDLFNSRGLALLAPFSKVSIKIPSGITFRNKRIRWRYLKGDSLFDNLLLLIACCLLTQLSYNIFM